MVVSLRLTLPCLRARSQYPSSRTVSKGSFMRFVMEFIQRFPNHSFLACWPAATLSAEWMEMLSGARATATLSAGWPDMACAVAVVIGSHKPMSNMTKITRNGGYCIKTLFFCCKGSEKV